MRARHGLRFCRRRNVSASRTRARRLRSLPRSQQPPHSRREPSAARKARQRSFASARQPVAYGHGLGESRDDELIRLTPAASERLRARRGAPRACAVAAAAMSDSPARSGCGSGAIPRSSVARTAGPGQPRCPLEATAHLREGSVQQPRDMGLRDAERLGHLGLSQVEEEPHEHELRSRGPSADRLSRQAPGRGRLVEPRRSQSPAATSVSNSTGRRAVESATSEGPAAPRASRPRRVRAAPNGALRSRR